MPGVFREQQQQYYRDQEQKQQQQQTRVPGHPSVPLPGFKLILADISDIFSCFYDFWLPLGVMGL